MYTVKTNVSQNYKKKISNPKGIANHEHGKIEFKKVKTESLLILFSNFIMSNNMKLGNLLIPVGVLYFYFFPEKRY